MKTPLSLIIIVFHYIYIYIPSCINCPWMSSRRIMLKGMYFSPVNIVLLTESVVSFNMDEKNMFSKMLYLMIS